MDFNINSRYNAFLEKKRFCKEKGSIDFYLLFSIKFIKKEDNIYIFNMPNPYDILDILRKYPNFMIVDIKNFKKKIYVFKVEKIEDGLIKSKMISKIDMDEKRVFERFYLCPEDFGYFNVFIKDKEVCKNSYIKDISITGIKIFIPKILDEEFKNITIKNYDKNLVIDIDVVNIIKNGFNMLISGEIVESNINLSNLIEEKYIEISTKLFKD